ncbi:MAG: substrate-binding domain-containing protein [Bacteroidota bacterium]
MTACDTPVNRPKSTESGAEQVKLDPSTAPASETATSGEIYITVDETLEPVVDALITNFQFLYKRATVHPIYLPGEEAIATMLNADSIRLAVATRELTTEETAYLKQFNITPDYAPIFKDGVSCIVSNQNSAQELTVEQLRQILSGERTTWEGKQTKQGGEEIRVVFDHRNSSTLQYLKEKVLQGEPMMKDRIFALENNPEVIRYVAENPQAIGIIGNAWISDTDDPEVRDFLAGIHVLRLDKPDEDVPCAFENEYFGPFQAFLDQNCYPLTREAKTILRESIFGLGTGFVAYSVGPIGQRLVHKSGLAAVRGIPREVKFPPKEGARDPRKYRVSE